MFATISLFPDFSVHKLIQSVQSHLRIFRNEHFLGFLDHGLWFELVLREAVFPWIEELSSGNAGQDQICRVRLEGHVHLNLLRVDRRRRHAVGVDFGFWQEKTERCIAVTIKSTE